MKLKGWGNGQYDQSSIHTSSSQEYSKRFKANIKGIHNVDYSRKMTTNKNGVNMILDAIKEKAQ